MKVKRVWYAVWALGVSCGARAQTPVVGSVAAGAADLCTLEVQNACVLQAQNLERAFGEYVQKKVSGQSGALASDPVVNASLKKLNEFKLQVEICKNGIQGKKQTADSASSRAERGRAGVKKAQAEMKTQISASKTKDLKRTGGICTQAGREATAEYGVCGVDSGTGLSWAAKSKASINSCAQQVEAARTRIYNHLRRNETQYTQNPQANVLKQVHVEWVSLNKALETIDGKLAATRDALGPLESQLKQTQGTCAQNSQEVEALQPGCTGGTAFADSTLIKPEADMPKSASTDSSLSTVADNPVEAQPATVDAPTESPVAGGETKPKDDTQVGATEPPTDQNESNDSTMTPHMPYSGNPQYMTAGPGSQQDYENDELREQIKALQNQNQQLAAQAQQAAQQAQQAAQGQGGGEEHPQQQQKQQQPQTASKPTTPATKSPAQIAAEQKLAEINAKIDANKKEIADKEKQIADTSAPFKQGAPSDSNQNQPTVIANGQSGDGSSNNQELVNTGSDSQTLASADKGTVSGGRSLVVAQKAPTAKSGLRSLAQQPAAQASGATFTAFKLDCNTGLGKCSKIPIACGSGGLSTDDQTTCNNEAAKRAKNKRRALVGVENP